VEAMLPHLRGHYGNASSIYQLGQEERKAVDVAREQMAKLIGVTNVEEIVFTGGGSESINWAIKGVAFANRAKGKTHRDDNDRAQRRHEDLQISGNDGLDSHVCRGGLARPDQSRAYPRSHHPRHGAVSIMQPTTRSEPSNRWKRLGRFAGRRMCPCMVDALQTVGQDSRRWMG